MGDLGSFDSVRAFFTDPQNQQNIVDLIGYASIFSAALFGMFGLFTEYKKDGKITIWGRLAAAGIALSAVFAMTSSVLQGRISAHKADTERKAAAVAAAKERADFKSELGRFTTLNEKLGESLNRARENMAATTALSAQERENAGHLMRGLWDDANRITPGSFEVELDYLCDSLDDNRPPQVMPEGSVAQIGISNGSRARAQRTRWYAFVTERLIPTPTYLESVDQRISTIREGPNGDFTKWRQVSQFSAFVARGADANKPSADLGRFADPNEWRDAAVEVVVRSSQPGIADRMFASVGWRDKNMEGAMELHSAENAMMYELPLSMVQNRHSWRALPCSVDMSVRVNHRTVATGRAAAIQLRGGSNDRAGPVVVKFPVVMAVPDALPQYAAIRRPSAAR